MRYRLHASCGIRRIYGRYGSFCKSCTGRQLRSVKPPWTQRWNDEIQRPNDAQVCREVVVVRCEACINGCPPCRSYKVWFRSGSVKMYVKTDRCTKWGTCLTRKMVIKNDKNSVVKIIGIRKIQRSRIYDRMWGIQQETRHGWISSKCPCILTNLYWRTLAIKWQQQKPNH